MAFAFPARHVHPRSAGILGWTLSPAANTNRIGFSRFGREDFLQADLVLPTVAEIVEVLEPLLWLETKIRKPDFVGVIGEGNATCVGGNQLTVRIGGTPNGN